jgi:hypothetical protein
MIRKGILSLRSSLSPSRGEESLRRGPSPSSSHSASRSQASLHEKLLQRDDPPQTPHYGRLLLLPYEEYRSLHQLKGEGSQKRPRIASIALQEGSSLSPHRWPPLRTPPPPAPEEEEDDLVDTPPEKMAASKSWECPQCTLLNDLDKLWSAALPSAIRDPPSLPLQLPSLLLTEAWLCQC